MATTAFGQSSASAPKPAAKAQPIERIEIEATDNNGFVVRCFKKTQGRSMMAMAEPSKHIFSDIAGLQGYISKELGGATAPPAPPVDTAVVESTEAPVAPTDMAAPEAVAAGPVDTGDVEDDGAYEDEDVE